MSKNDPAFPCDVEVMLESNTWPTIVKQVRACGLTKRELFAAMAMQGILMHPKTVCKTDEAAQMIDDVSKSAVIFADTLLAALDAKEGE